MSASYSIGFGEPQSLGQMRDLAPLVDAGGYECLWLAETSGPDVMVTAGVIAAATERVQLGTLIAPVYTRTPAVLAMAASTVADVSGRPFRLGLGTGGQAMVEHWHGQPFRRPLARVEQTVAVVRAAVAGEKTNHPVDETGSVGFRLRRDGGARVELLVAALGDKMLDLAASIADGVLLTWVPIDRAAGVIGRVRAAVERAGRDPATVRVTCRVLVAVTDEPGDAWKRMPEALSMYLTSPPYNRFFAAQGFAPEAAAFAAAFARRDRAAALAAVSDGMAQQLVVAGTAAACRDELARLAAAGADEIVIAPFAQLGDDVVRATIEGLTP